MLRYDKSALLSLRPREPPPLPEQLVGVCLELEVEYEVHSSEGRWRRPRRGAERGRGPPPRDEAHPRLHGRRPCPRPSRDRDGRDDSPFGEEHDFGRNHGNQGGWRRAPLKRSEGAWAPKSRGDGEGEADRGPAPSEPPESSPPKFDAAAVVGMLNKLCRKNFTEKAPAIAAMAVDHGAELAAVLVDKAVNERVGTNAEVYAQLCSMCKGDTFRRAVLNEVGARFEARHAPVSAPASLNDQQRAEWEREGKAEQVRAARSGNVARLVGEMYSSGMLPCGFVLRVVHGLVETHDADTLCVLLGDGKEGCTGARLDAETSHRGGSAQTKMGDAFSEMKRWTRPGSVEGMRPQSRFAVLDLVEARERGWAARKSS